MSQAIQLNITGMTCDHCVRSVTSAVQEVEGVTSAKVSLKDRSALVEGENLDVQKIVEAIREEGYEAALK